MLTADQIEALGDKAQKITEPIIEFLIQDIARRVSEAGQLASTASYQTWRLQNLGMSQQQIKKEIAKRLRVSQKEAEQLMTQAAEVGYNFDLKNLPTADAISFSQNETVQQIVSAAVQMAQDDLSNMVQTLGFVGQDGKCRELTEAYQQACDFAFTKVATGAQDYNSAIREATKGLAQKGIRTINYESGVHTSMEAAVRRNVMSGLGTMQEQISQQNHDDLGCDGWEISAHAASAPDHEPIQGRQYSDEAYKRLNNSLVRRIGTLNCGHAAFPIILGVNSPQYSPEELEKFRKDNEKGIEYEGKHYTIYEATQRQRKLERAIRDRKHRILIDEAAGDKEQLAIDQTKLVRLNDEYARFTKAAKLRSQRERANVPGFGPKQARAAKKTLDNPSKAGYNEVQKLQYSGAVNPKIEASIEKSLSKMPARHRELAESRISGIEITDSQTGSSYSRRTGTIRLSRFADPDTAIHEYAHALAESLGAYDDPKFKAILKKGLEDISPADIVFDDESFVEPIYRVESNKFVSKYQGRLYEEVGIFNGTEVSLDGMLDYFSEGYEEYIRNPGNLIAHDPDLFAYFEGIT